MARLGAFLFSLFFLFLIFNNAIFAQEIAAGNVVTNQTNVILENKPELPLANEETMNLQAEEPVVNEPTDVKWVWGDVVSVDAGGASIKVRYLDYETDSQAEAIFYVDKDSVFENIASLEGIKVGDSAGIDYSISKDGKNIIKSISTEKLGN